MSAPSRDWRETIAPDEETAFAALSTELAGMARARDAGGAPRRALHPRGHLGLAATLVVPDGLPEHARQGLFGAAGEHRAYVRLSNGSARAQHDKAPDLRGFALKVLDVEGKKILGDASTQDFLMVDAETLPFRSVGEFMAIVRAGKDPKRLLPTLISELGFFGALGLLGRLATSVKGNRRSLLDLSYSTVAPVAFGPYAARVRLVPRHPPGPGGNRTDRSYLRDEASARAEASDLSFEVAGQFFTSEAETPLDAIDRKWTAPWTPLGTLRLEPRPTGEAAAELDRFVESLSFDPWHALEAHRPLGSVMRARKATYFESVNQRGGAAEPTAAGWPTPG